MLAKRRPPAPPPWLQFVYAVAIAWSIAHCYITASGTQEQRNTAALVGVFGAISILIVLHFGIAHYVQEIARRDAELAMLRAVIADASDDQLASPGTPERAPAAQDRQRA